MLLMSREKDKNGGLIPDSKKERKRAKKADLVSLPLNIAGTNCSNCLYSTREIPEDLKDEVPAGSLYCKNDKVEQPVNERMCCYFWDNNNAIRNFKDE